MLVRRSLSIARRTQLAYDASQSLPSSSTRPDLARATSATRVSSAARSLKARYPASCWCYSTSSSGNASRESTDGTPREPRSEQADAKEATFGEHRTLDDTQDDARLAQQGANDSLLSNEPRSENPAPSKYPMKGSYLDALFSGPNAFHRDDDLLNQQQHTASHNRTNERDRRVLDSPTYRQAERELNREWPTYQHTSRPASSSTRAPHNRSLHPAKMNASERAVFGEIFTSVFSDGTPYAGGANPRSSLDDGLFGSLGGNTKEQRLRAFYEQAVNQRAQMRAGIPSQPQRKSPKVFAAALMQELLSVEGVNEAQVNERIDVARVQLQACQSQNEVWEWADRNVWPANEHELNKAGISSASDVNAAARMGSMDMSSSDAVGSLAEERPFGMRTPLYAPVLFMMFKELRDRFRAPHAALAVLRTARNLGPESMVMGCTSDLYAEAIRTSWNVLGDLQGARDLVKEARDTGILSGSFSQHFHRDFAGQRAERERASATTDEWQTLQDDSKIGKVVDDIKQDVRRTTFRAQKSMGLDVQSHLLNHQSAIAEEMVRIVAPMRAAVNDIEPPRPDGTRPYRRTQFSSTPRAFGSSSATDYRPDASRLRGGRHARPRSSMRSSSMDDRFHEDMAFMRD